MSAFDPGVKFLKSGAEVKAAINVRLADLEARLSRRNAELEAVMSDRPRLRSFLVRDLNNDYPHGMQYPQEMPSEDHQHILELCKRINRIEKEMAELQTTRDNLRDEQQLTLDYDELTALGFGAHA